MLPKKHKSEAQSQADAIAGKPVVESCNRFFVAIVDDAGVLNPILANGSIHDAKDEECCSGSIKDGGNDCRQYHFTFHKI